MHFSCSEALHMQLHQQPNVPVFSEHTKFVEFVKPLFEWREKKIKTIHILERIMRLKSKRPSSSASTQQLHIMNLWNRLQYPKTINNYNSLKEDEQDVK